MNIFPESKISEPEPDERWPTHTTVGQKLGQLLDFPQIHKEIMKSKKLTPIYIAYSTKVISLKGEKKSMQAKQYMKTLYPYIYSIYRVYNHICIYTPPVVYI